MKQQTNGKTKRADTRIILPALLAVALFVISIFVIIIPTMRSNIMDRKRELIRELTNTAWSVLLEYAEEEKKGTLTREAAKNRAIADIRYLRYGDERKDYFWITDTQPIMIMHPYKPQMEGKDLAGKDGEDPRGKKLFVEMVRVCEQKPGGGFVDYMWQWKDDATRIVPKLSYVKGFAPWNWIIGTGIYIEDVKEEISAITNRLITVSIVIIVVISLLLFFNTRQSLEIEDRRIRAEQDLRESEKKYRALVDASTQGTMMVLEGRYIYSNQPILDLLGYSAQEFRAMSLATILADEESGEAADNFKRLLQGGKGKNPFEARLQCQDGSIIETELTISTVQLGGKNGFIIIAREIGSQKKMAEELAQRKQKEQSREDLIVQLQTTQLYFNQPIKEILIEVPRCSMELSISKASKIMTRGRFSAVLVTASAEEEKNRAIGIVTDSDLRRRVLSEGIEPSTALYQIMSSPLMTVPDSALIFEALLLMQEQGIRHLAVKNRAGKVVSLISDQQLLHLQLNSSAYLIREIHESGQMEDLVATMRRMPRLAKALIDSGAVSESICRIFSTISDAVTDRLIHFAIEELGPPPSAFAFMALGSEGREEPTLKTDQDNAIIYSDPGPGKQAETYFLQLGEKVNGGLHRCGYTFCEGEVMARNPRWCQPLSGWKKHFHNWIHAAAPQDLLEVNIFFDFRCLYGDSQLTQQLRDYIHQLSSDRPEFFQFIARNALLYKPPIGFFGKIVTDSSQSGPGTFDIKDAMRPIVNFARLYALKHNVDATNTQERLHHLYTANVLTRSSYDEMGKIYDYMMQMRLRHQAKTLAENGETNNFINPGNLTDIEHTLLKNMFSQINNFQKRLSYDFTGS